VKDAHVKELEKMLTPELQALAKVIDDSLPDGWGFGLMIFEMNHEPDGPLLWVSNARREDMIEAMKEYIEKRGGA
jgi:hypothetical protein